MKMKTIEKMLEDLEKKNTKIAEMYELLGYLKALKLFKVVIKDLIKNYTCKEDLQVVLNLIEKKNEEVYTEILGQSNRIIPDK